MGSACGSSAELWSKCPGCHDIVYRKEITRRLNVCPRCNFHFRLTAQERLIAVVDPGSFREMDAELSSSDFLGFGGDPPYQERLEEARARTGRREAVITGEARIRGFRVALAVFDFAFMGGSMGTVVGEKLVRLIELAAEARLPLVVFSSSGGARMQEGMFSLVQMAKIAAALARLRERGVVFISVLTDPTTGGVAASLAMLGDVNLAEPGALIGFAGPRVIEQTINQRLPEGFQRAEFLYEHGMVDAVVSRRELRGVLARLLRLFGAPVEA